MPGLVRYAARMPDFLDHALAAILILALPPRAWLAFRTLLRAGAEQRPAVRKRLYLGAMLTQWALVALVILRWLLSRRLWTAIGLVPVITPGAIGVGIGVAVIVILIVMQLRAASGDSEVFERARARLQHVEPLLPHSPGELQRFRMVAVTAGICEELLFRGFLIWYFAHYTGLIQAALISSVSFGLGHAYQGVRYVFVTGLLGAFLAAVYLISGSIVLSMLIHTLMDLYSGWVGYRLFGGAGGAAAPAAPEAPA